MISRLVVGDVQLTSNGDVKEGVYLLLWWLGLTSNACRSGNVPAVSGSLHPGDGHLMAGEDGC